MAGTCVAARSKYGMGTSCGSPHDASPSGSEGRVTVAWVDGVLRGGILVVSVYLWHSEGLADRNRKILEVAAEAVVRHGGPWMIVGDFNMTPPDLQAEMDHWLQRINGQIFAPKENTCNSSSGGRVIDFAILDARISSGVVGVWVDYSCPSNPHRAVRIRI